MTPQPAHPHLSFKYSGQPARAAQQQRSQGTQGAAEIREREEQYQIGDDTGKKRKKENERGNQTIRIGEYIEEKKKKEGVEGEEKPDKSGETKNKEK